jgi:hypothetical protein
MDSLVKHFIFIVMKKDPLILSLKPMGFSLVDILLSLGNHGVGLIEKTKGTLSYLL